MWFKDTWLKKQIVTNTIDELNSCYEVPTPPPPPELEPLTPPPYTYIAAQEGTLKARPQVFLPSIKQRLAARRSN